MAKKPERVMWYDQYAAALEDEKMPAEFAASVSVLPMACSLHRETDQLAKNLKNLDAADAAATPMLTCLTPCPIAATCPRVSAQRQKVAQRPYLLGMGASSLPSMAGGRVKFCQ